MTPPKLHLDADTSRKALLRALRERGHDVTRTPCEWMALDASDEVQLRQATTHGRVLFTFNVADFAKLAANHPSHAGILLAHQGSWSLAALIHALDHMLTTMEAEQLRNHVRWLNDWRQ